VSAPDANRVVMHIASWNTTRVTELCIRSMRHYAGREFELVVGDGGSTDGSLDMLRKLEARGWLQLEVAPEGRKHAEWLDHWVEHSPARFAGFSDSDVEYLRPGWLDDLVSAATASNAALTCARMQWPPPEFRHPTTGAARRLAPRPTPWLFLLDLDQVRDRVRASFRYRDEIDPDAFGGKVAYDVGAAYYAELDRAGLTWTEMPEAFQSKFRHFGGLTWLKAGNTGASWRVRSKQLAKLGLVHTHLWRARAAGWGTTIPTA
jgi:glycosyltransferase involved in cell wall biosynthesis